jgi:hypothetical protein
VTSAPSILWGSERVLAPKNIPELASRYTVAEEKKDPNWVRKLKGLVRSARKKKAFYRRIFDKAQDAQAGVRAKDWTWLGEHPDFIIWEDYSYKETNTVRREKFVKLSTSSNESLLEIIRTFGSGFKRK